MPEHSQVFRGIERNPIFSDDQDRDALGRRFALENRYRLDG